MLSEFDDTTEPKDRTALWWGGIALVVVVMAVVLWFRPQAQDAVSQVRFRYILISYKANDASDRARALDLITNIRERIAKGESFASLAQTYSNDEGTRNRGGDMGYIAKGQMEEVVEAYVWKAPLHKLSEILQSTSGFFLVEVTDRRLSKADLYNQELERREEERSNADAGAKKPAETKTPESAAPKAATPPAAK